MEYIYSRREKILNEVESTSISMPTNWKLDQLLSSQEVGTQRVKQHMTPRNFRKQRHALSERLRQNIITVHQDEFRPASDIDTLVEPFYGDENAQQSRNWIRIMQNWGSEENLSPEERWNYAFLALFGDAFRWCRKLQLQRATWREFYYLFTETFVRRWPVWRGSLLYPYCLQFHGVARGNPGHAGVGAILTTPNQEHDFSLISTYLGPHCMSHVASYEALIAGLENALKYGVKYVVACGDDTMIINQVMVKRLWKVPSDPELKHCLSQVWYLEEQFTSFEIVSRNERRYHSPPARLANKAIDNCPHPNCGEKFPWKKKGCASTRLQPERRVHPGTDPQWTWTPMASIEASMTHAVASLYQ